LQEILRQTVWDVDRTAAPDGTHGEPELLARFPKDGEAMMAVFAFVGW
jgi:hypothetical protein